MSLSRFFLKKLRLPGERRTREARPVLVYLAGGLLVLVPVYSLYGIAAKFSIPFLRPDLVLTRLTLPEQVLLALSPVSGVGLLAGRAWGWWSFLVFAAGLLVYNLYVIIRVSTDTINVAVLIQSLLFLGLIFLFLRRDFAFPFLKRDRLATRAEKRQIPAGLVLVVNGISVQIIDLNARGARIIPDPNEHQPEPGAEVRLSLYHQARPDAVLGLRGGVVRVSAGEVAIAFRETTPGTRRYIRRLIQKTGPGPGQSEIQTGQKSGKETE